MGENNPTMDIPPLNELVAHYTVSGQPVCDVCRTPLEAGDDDPKNETGDTVGIAVPYRDDDSRSAEMYCQSHMTTAVEKAKSSVGLAVISGPFVTQFSADDTYGLWGHDAKFLYPRN